LLAATGALMGGMLDVELRVAIPEADEYCEIIEESRRAETAARDSSPASAAAAVFKKTARGHRRRRS
jgi:hypothetical protein